MYKFWTNCTNYLVYRQLGFWGALLCTSVCLGQTTPNRAPASYIPDDDVIIKPEANEISFYQQHMASDNSEDVAVVRNQIKVWNDNQVFASQYGLNTNMAGSQFYVPNEDEKWQYFKNKYLRYLRRKSEAPLKEMPKTWYQQYRASNEIDTIDEMEARFKKTSTTTTRGSALPKSLQEKEVSIWKDTKFVFQPRLDQGLVIVGLRGKALDARAWVGVNGRTEINVQQRVDSVGFRIMFNYYAHSGEYFTSVDQRLMENIYARYTVSKNPEIEVASEVNDNTLMLLYAKTF
jgi:hypothetical protein